MINAGGAVAFGTIHQQGETDPVRLRARVEGIGTSLREMFEEAAAADESPLHAARRRARRFLDRAVAARGETRAAAASGRT